MESRICLFVFLWFNRPFYYFRRFRKRDETLCGAFALSSGLHVIGPNLSAQNTLPFRSRSYIARVLKTFEVPDGRGHR